MVLFDKEESGLGTIPLGIVTAQRLRVFNPCTNGLGETGEEVRARSWELVAVDEPTVISNVRGVGRTPWSVDCGPDVFGCSGGE